MPSLGMRGKLIAARLSVVVLTAVASAFLDNVTTVLLLGSVTVAISNQLGINPVPLLITQVLASNIGGTATLIGDPPNIMIGSAANLSFNEFLIHLAPVIVFFIGPVCLATLAWMFRNDLKLPFGARRAMARLSMEGVITDRPLMIKALVVIGLVILGFLFHHALHLQAGTIALAGASVLVAFAEGMPRLGRWQAIFLCEFDGPRSREIWLERL